MNDKIDDFSRKTFKIILHGDWRVTGKQNIILRNVNIVANIWTRKEGSTRRVNGAPRRRQLLFSPSIESRTPFSIIYRWAFTFLLLFLPKQPKKIERSGTSHKCSILLKYKVKCVTLRYVTVRYVTCAIGNLFKSTNLEIDRHNMAV
jgi:hypothetical protein